jgi:hypothetical protein
LQKNSCPRFFGVLRGDASTTRNERGRHGINEEATQALTRTGAVRHQVQLAGQTIHVSIGK